MIVMSMHLGNKLVLSTGSKPRRIQARGLAVRRPWVRLKEVEVKLSSKALKVSKRVRKIKQVKLNWRLSRKMKKLYILKVKQVLLLGIY